jgi:O-acetyl-ADP-ribose deacetylase (regulator of RNase III)
MVQARIGDLFASEAQTLVNTVNCVGVMGKGVALEFKKRFPAMYEDYVVRCAKGQVQLGKPYLYRELHGPWVLNFPTKGHWRSVSRLADIAAGLEYLMQHYREWGITSLAVPPLGCGQGGLEWRVVGPTLYRYLSQLDIPVELYAPPETPSAQLEPAFLVGTETMARATKYGEGRIKPAWLALVEVLARIDQELYHWPVGRTSFQKIAYFATDLGIPTGLEYRRGSYGPFAADLKPLITRLVNHGLIREEQLGRMLRVRPGPTYPDAAKACQAELAAWSPIIDRLVDLFLRLQTNQAEVAATVHFAARALHSSGSDKPTEGQILAEVKQWKQKRRPPLKDEQIAQTIRNLNILGWIDAQPSGDLPLPEESVLDA